MLKKSPLALAHHRTQKPDLLEAGACDITDCKSAQKPHLLKLQLTDVPYYYFTMPRCQTGQRLRLAHVPY